MKIKVFTLHVDDDSGRFDDSELTTFLTERDALGVYHHFYDHDGVPRLALVVPYRDGPRTRAPQPRKPDGELEIPPEDRPLYEALRQWRNERARKEGRPSYILFNNPQLAGIAHARPATKEALAGVPGVGQGRLRDYADEILALVLAAGAAGG